MTTMTTDQSLTGLSLPVSKKERHALSSEFGVAENQENLLSWKGSTRQHFLNISTICTELWPTSDPILGSYTRARRCANYTN